MPPLNLELDLELNSDVDKVTAINYLVRLLRNRELTQYIENHPAAYNEVLAAVQEIPQPKPLPTPGSTPQEEPDTDGQADQHNNDFVELHDHSSLSQGRRPLYCAYIEDADDSTVERTSDNTQRSVNLDVWPPSDHNNDTYDQDARQEKQPSEPTVTSSIRHRLDTPPHTSSKRKQHFEDGGASKRAHIELVDAPEGGPGSSSTRYRTRWTYEELALRYYMLVSASSRTSEIRDMVKRILARVLGANKSEGLDKYQLGLTEIFLRTDMLALLENLRTTRLDHCATVIQKNLKARYYRRKYLEARNAILLIQSVIRRHLAWKHTQENRKIKAATTIQRLWRGQKQRKSFNAIRNNVVLIQAAAKRFLRRREIMDTRFGKAAVLIQRLWRLRRHMKSWRQYRRKVVIVQRLWRGKCARRRCEKIREAEASSTAVGQGDHGNDRLAELSANWRTQLQRIKSIEVLEDCQRFCHMVRHPVTSIDIRPDQDAVERSGGPDMIPTRYRRLKQVKFMLEDGWEKEKSLDVPKIALQVSRRLHLVELTASYMADTAAEKAASKKRRQSTVRETYVDLLFPHTIKYKGKKARKGKKGKKVSDQEGQQVSGKEVREKAEKRFDYFIRVGKPLWKMSECYGLSILAILPKEVTEASLFALALGKNQDQDVVDYIDVCHPGLKEQISNLSSLLPGIIAGGLPSKWLVIETIPHRELSDHPFEELFQFSNDHESSKLGDLRSAEPSQPPQVHANEQLLYAQGTTDSVQSIRPDCTSESLQSRSLSVAIEDGNSSNSTTDYSEFAQPWAHYEKSDYYQQLDQEFNRYMEEPSSFQDDDQSPQMQPGHRAGFPNPQAYYCQDVDWRAQQPSAWEGEFLDPQDSDLQRSGPSDTEFSDLDSVIKYSPQNTTSVASISPSQSPARKLPAHLVDVPRASTPRQLPSPSTYYSTLATEPDIKPPALADSWQDEGMTDCMMAWTAHDQGAGTINPEDLFQTSL